MATSGIVGVSRFNFADILELATYRCKLKPTIITAEIVAVAKQGLFLTLLSLANRGLNLWRIDHDLMSVQTGRIQYDLPAGTMAVSNINFVANTVSDGTLSAVAGGYQFDLDSSFAVPRVGFKASSSFTAALAILTSGDGISFSSQVSVPSASYVSGRWYWFDLPVTETIEAFQITSAVAFTANELAACNQLSIIPMWQWNRDEYSQQPVRTQPGRQVTNFYFDRQRDPFLWVWPNPTNEHDHFEYWIHRQIEDINQLTEEIDVPSYWINASVWLLAKELCFSLPVDPSASAMVMAEADRILNEAEMGQTDNSSTFITPRIGVYTK